MIELEESVYLYIFNNILSVQKINAVEFFDLFSKLISNEGWCNAPEKLKNQILNKIVGFAKTKGVELDFNKLLEMNENTNSKRI